MPISLHLIYFLRIHSFKGKWKKINLLSGRLVFGPNYRNLGTQFRMTRPPLPLNREILCINHFFPVTIQSYLRLLSSRKNLSICCRERRRDDKSCWLLTALLAACCGCCLGQGLDDCCSNLCCCGDNNDLCYCCIWWNIFFDNSPYIIITKYN